MRKEFTNAKAKHGLNSKKMGKKANWHKAKHGLITKAKISFGLQKYKGELKRIGEGEKRRREEKEEKKKKKRRRRRREEEGSGI